MALLTCRLSDKDSNDPLDEVVVAILELPVFFGMGVTAAGKGPTAGCFAIGIGGIC